MSAAEPTFDPALGSPPPLWHLVDDDLLVPRLTRGRSHVQTRRPWEDVTGNPPLVRAESEGQLNDRVRSGTQRFTDLTLLSLIRQHSSRDDQYELKWTPPPPPLPPAQPPASLPNSRGWVSYLSGPAVPPRSVATTQAPPPPPFLSSNWTTGQLSLEPPFPHPLPTPPPAPTATTPAPKETPTPAPTAKAPTRANNLTQAAHDAVQKALANGVLYDTRDGHHFVSDPVVEDEIFSKLMDQSGDDGYAGLGFGMSSAKEQEACVTSEAPDSLATWEWCLPQSDLGLDKTSGPTLTHTGEHVQLKIGDLVRLTPAADYPAPSCPFHVGVDVWNGNATGRPVMHPPTTNQVFGEFLKRRAQKFIDEKLPEATNCTFWQTAPLGRVVVEEQYECVVVVFPGPHEMPLRKANGGMQLQKREEFRISVPYGGESDLWWCKLVAQTPRPTTELYPRPEQTAPPNASTDGAAEAETQTLPEVGSKIQIWWHKYMCYLAGEVIAARTQGAVTITTVKYEDGEVREYVLDKVCYRLPDDADPPLPPPPDFEVLKEGEIWRPEAIACSVAPVLHRCDPLCVPGDFLKATKKGQVIPEETKEETGAAEEKTDATAGAEEEETGAAEKKTVGTASTSDADLAVALGSDGGCGGEGGGGGADGGNGGRRGGAKERKANWQEKLDAKGREFGKWLWKLPPRAGRVEPLKVGRAWPEPVPIDPETSTMCCICMEDEKPIYSVSGAQGGTCKECLGMHFTTTIDGSRYSAAPMLCPLSRKRVPMASWHSFVASDDMNKYVSFPRALLKIRCSGCDQVGDMFEAAAFGEERLRLWKTIRRRLLRMHQRVGGQDENSQELSEATQEAGLYLLLLWRQYVALDPASQGQGQEEGAAEDEEELQELTANEFIDRVCQMWGPTSSWAHFAKAVDGEPGPDLALVIPSLARLIVDTERRAALTLAFLRKFPMMKTPCCSTDMCFKCKTDGHHGPSEHCFAKPRTCVQMAKEEAEIDAQFCPACGVATVRSEGCNHIICVCGHHWTWEGEADY